MNRILARSEKPIKAYRAATSDSGVSAYETGPESIVVRFKNDSIYLYNYASTGKRDIEAMKKLAEKGEGLSTYISQNVKSRYAEKLK